MSCFCVLSSFRSIFWHGWQAASASSQHRTSSSDVSISIRNSGRKNQSHQIINAPSKSYSSLLIYLLYGIFNFYKYFLFQLKLNRISQTTLFILYIIFEFYRARYPNIISIIILSLFQFSLVHLQFVFGKNEMSEHTIFDLRNVKSLPNFRFYRNVFRYECMDGGRHIWTNFHNMG